MAEREQKELEEHLTSIMMEVYQAEPQERPKSGARQQAHVRSGQSRARVNKRMSPGGRAAGAAKVGRASEPIVSVLFEQVQVAVQGCGRGIWPWRCLYLFRRGFLAVRAVLRM